MSEWWTYRLSSFLLFSPRTYFRLHELYNADVWPSQLVAFALGVAILFLARRAGAGWHGRVIAAILAIGWLWVAWAFHLRRYATINWAATYFAAAFAIQALLLVWTGVIRGRLTFASGPLTRQAGFHLVLFALVVQPAIGPLLGRSWAASEVFGIAPDPTAVGTLGFLLLVKAPASWTLMAIPLLWCVVSGAFQWTMRSPDAWVMPAIALLVLVSIAVKSKRPENSGPAVSTRRA